VRVGFFDGWVLMRFNSFLVFCLVGAVIFDWVVKIGELLGNNEVLMELLGMEN
jgi:hypothetical protein